MAKDELDRELLEEMEEDAAAGLGHVEMENREWAGFLLPGLDYDAQLHAIREEIKNKRNREQIALKRIENAEKIPKDSIRSTWDQIQAEDEFLDSCELYTYQSAAHSASATGMLAPFIESIFRKLGQTGPSHLEPANLPLNNLKRKNFSSTEQFWDCTKYIESERHKEDIASGINQIGRHTGIFNRGQTKIITALFKYRNFIFHNGIEWPPEKLKEFEKFIHDQNFPDRWFSQARSGDVPWFIFMTDEFIDEVLDTAEIALDGIGCLALKAMDSQSPQ